MLEAITQLEIRNFTIIVSPVQDSISPIKRLLDTENIRYRIEKLTFLKGDLAAFCRNHKEKYDNIFIGNYYQPTWYTAAALLINRGGNVLYLDDGNQILTIDKINDKGRFKSLPVRLLAYIIGVVFAIKGVKTNCFFSIYEKEVRGANVLNNKFDRIRKQITSDARNIYIIGTNSSLVKFKDISYYDLLKNLISYCRRRYGDEKILYCPHRRDLNNDTLKQFCYDNQIMYYETKVSVEYDFLIHKIFPVAVYGFMSNALFSLHKIYTDTIIGNVSFELDSLSENEESNKIRKEYEENGIPSIDITTE